MKHPVRRPGRTPLTIGEMQAIAAEHGGKCRSEHYVNANTRLEWECARGHRWLAIPNSVKRGTWCRMCSMEQQKPSLADIERAARERGGHCLSDAYIDRDTPLLFECAAGHRWEAKAIAIRTGRWCQRCLYDRRRGTLAAMQMLAASRGGQCLSEAYSSQRHPLRWRCASGHEWQSPGRTVRDHWCPHCERERRRTGIARMHEIAAARGGRCLSESYVNTHSPIEWQCAKAHRWRQPPAVITRGQWCPYCSGHRRYTLADMQALARARGGECLSDAYISVHHKLQWLCELGHAWSTRPAAIVRGTWCPECAILARCLHEKARRKYQAVRLPEEEY